MTRGSRASHSATVSLPGSPASGGTSLGLDRREAGFGQERLDLLVGEAEAAMRELLAQEFFAVRGEVDDEQPAAGTQARAPLRAGRARDRRENAAPGG